MYAHNLNRSVLSDNEGVHPPIHIQLTNEQMWTEFNNVTLENIVTWEGRRLFPNLNVLIGNLQPSITYDIYIDLIERGRYTWTNNQWIKTHDASSTTGIDNAEHVQQLQAYLHRNSPNLGSFWMANPVSFAHLKLTTRTTNLLPNQITVKPMHMYVPRIQIMQRQSMDQGNVLVHSQTLLLAEFIAVTNYRNIEVTTLKIMYNPYAQGFLMAHNMHPRMRSAFVAG